MVKKTKKVSKTEATEQKQGGPTRRFQTPLLIILCSIVALLLVSVGAGLWYFRDRALPNVTIGQTPIGLKPEAEIRQAIQQQELALKVTLSDGQQQATVPIKELGVTVNYDATLQHVLNARKQGDLLANLAVWQAQTVPLVLQTDPGILKKYIADHYPAAFVDPKDAQLAYNDKTEQFDIQPGTQGKGFDVTWLQRALPDLAANPHSITLAIATKPIDPIIQEKNLGDVQKQANEQIKLPLTFSKDGAVKYTAKPAQIASWMRFIPDAVKGTYGIEFDKTSIQQFLDQQVAPTVATTAIDRKVIVDPNTGAQTVLTPGRTGQQIKDTEAIANDVMKALAERKAHNQVIAVTDAPFKTVTIKGDSKWIEIDLSKQRLTLYLDNTPINSWLISSGKARTPTPVGTFRIWSKHASQTMTGTIAGDYYYLPNVKWVNYVVGEVAIHGTYWHNNFGNPMSHGCINMTEAAAKVVYDFAPVGTKVVIHY